MKPRKLRNKRGDDDGVCRGDSDGSGEVIAPVPVLAGETPPSAPSTSHNASIGGATALPPLAGPAAVDEEAEEKGATPIFVEYVHIASGSAVVKVGDVVRKGDLLCRSGDVGFCPTPHLHIQVHKESRRDAPTAPFCFLCKDQATAYVPTAGHWYSADGPVVTEDAQ